MFKENKYSRCYFSIISRAQSRAINGYTETHHIIPTSLGGTNLKINLVKLTAREHYICHLLLPKMTDGASRHKMIYAFTMMSGRKIYGSRKYAFYRKEHALINSKLRSGKGNGMFGANRKGEKNTFFNKQHSEETKQKISSKKKGVSIVLPPKTAEHKAALSKSHLGKGEKFTFVHQLHGTFIGTNADLVRAFPEIFNKSYHAAEVWKLSKGHYRSCKGWKILANP